MAHGLAAKHKKYALLKKRYADYREAECNKLGAVVAIPCSCSCPLCGKKHVRGTVRAGQKKFTKILLVEAGY